MSIGAPEFPVVFLPSLHSGRRSGQTEPITYDWGTGRLGVRIAGFQNLEKFALDWEELPAGQDSRISVSLDDADPENEADWTRQHEWLAKRLNEMHRVLAPRVRALDSDSW